MDAGPRRRPGRRGGRPRLTGASVCALHALSIVDRGLVLKHEKGGIIDDGSQTGRDGPNEVR